MVLTLLTSTEKVLRAWYSARQDRLYSLTFRKISWKFVSNGEFIESPLIRLFFCLFGKVTEMESFHCVYAMQDPPNILREVCDCTFLACGRNLKILIGK